MAEIVQWEYRVQSSISRSSIESELNRWGKHGWELVQIIYSGVSGDIVFKRVAMDVQGNPVILSK